MNIKIDLFDIEGIWEVGTKIYFSNEYISISPIEKEAYDFYFRYANDPFLGVDFKSFPKRINHIYSQKVGALKDLKKELEEDERFNEVRFLKKPSAIGLPNILSYKGFGYEIEFDGVVFVIKRLLKKGTFIINKAQDFVNKQGINIVNFLPIPKTEKRMMSISAETNWRYVSGSMSLKEENFNKLSELVFYLDFLDLNIKYKNYPTGRASEGKRFFFLLGEKEHITQIIAHESETIRLLFFLEETLREIKQNIIHLREVIKPALLVPLKIKDFWNLKKWNRVKDYWEKVHRNFEDVIDYKMRLSILLKLCQTYQNFADNGISFYNLKSPFQLGNEENEMAQYITSKPFPIEIGTDKVVIKEYNKKICSYKGSPERLIKFHSFIDDITNETLELIKNITTTSSVYTSVSGSFLAWIALIIAIISLILSFLP